MNDPRFPWNHTARTSEFWDTQHNLPTSITQSLKFQLAHPNGIRTEDGIANICIGLAMIMDEIEELKKKLKD